MQSCSFNPNQESVRYSLSDRLATMSAMPRVMHNVVIQVKDTATQDEINAFFHALVELKERNLIPGILSISYGPYDSPEGLNKGFNYGFSMVFENEEARNTYLPHPEHERVKLLILPLLQDGINSVVAFDWKLQGNNESH